jgi:hypothetical protein
MTDKNVSGQSLIAKGTVFEPSTACYLTAPCAKDDLFLAPVNHTYTPVVLGAPPRSHINSYCTGDPATT